jgi:hypothetical protein
MEVSSSKEAQGFFWLLLKDRLGTRNTLRRRNQGLPYYNCVLCSAQVEETLSHLFIDCPFAQACWNVLHLFIQPGDPLDILASFRFQLNVVFLMDIIIIMSWYI